MSLDVIRTAFAALTIVALAACSRPAVTLPPAGSMDVLGPVPALEPSAVPPDWIVEGEVTRGQLTVVDRAGVPALMVVNGAHNIITAKPTYASLLATPYLSWAWNMEPQESGAHPVRLVVGFHGGTPQSLPWQGQPVAAGGPPLPPHDRAVLIIWGESALQRGGVVVPSSTAPPRPPARYTARGGQENARSWWLETVDLSDIYRRAWPGDDPARVRIAFIGIAALGGKAVSPGYLSGIRLSR